MYKITIGVDGMMCNMCEAQVNDKIRNIFKVKKVESSHSKNETVIITKEEISKEALEKAITETGYSFTSYNIEPYKKKGFFK